MYYNHVEQMKDFINERLARGVRTFTHKDIINVTRTNCPYSVLKNLKKYYEIEFGDTVRKTEKKDMKGNLKYVDIKFRTYTIIKRKDKNVEEFSVWREGQVNQLPLIFMGESIS